MSVAKTAARTLAGFDNGLVYEQIPAAARERARQCIIDTTGRGNFPRIAPSGNIVSVFGR